MRWGLGILLAGVAAIAIAAYAVGASKSSDGVTLCAAKQDGVISLAAKGKCGKGEKKLVLSKQGPQGAPGLQGPAGPAGSAGTLALEQVHYVTGPPTPECPAKPGTFCKFTGVLGGWRNDGDTSPGIARVGFYKDTTGIVHLLGVARYISEGGGLGGFEPEGPFYLPVGYRPGEIEVFRVAGGASLETDTTVEVRPDGTVAVLSGNYAALSGITFRP